MRIAHVTTVHRWDDGRIFERQARSLQRAGHEVTVLAPGTERFSVDGVDVIPLGIAHRRTDRMWRLVREAGRVLRTMALDVVVVHDPELLRLLVSLSLRRSAPILVYDAHEDYAAQLRDKEWLPRRLRGVLSATLGRVEQFSVGRLDHVLAATPAIARRFDPSRTTVVLNRPEVTSLAVLPSPAVSERVDAVARKESTVVYIGDLRAVRGATALVDAIARLGNWSARLRLAGRITPPSLEDELESLPGWDRVEVCGWLALDEVFGLLAEADVGVLPFLPAANHVESQPNKLFEYLVMGLPVAMSDFPTWVELARSVGGRFEVFTPGDAGALAEAIAKLLSDPESSDRVKRSARAREVLSWERCESSYVRCIESLLVGTRRVK